MARAIVIPTSGEVELREIATDLASLQAIVGGWIESVTFTEEVHLYCDEEGKFKGAEPNRVATWFAASMLPGWDDVIMGPVVVLGMTPDGEEADVPAEIVELFRRASIGTGEPTYRIVRFFQDDDRPRRTIRTGLALEEAQAHCRRQDTHGEGWFDGYTDDEEEQA